MAVMQTSRQSVEAPKASFLYRPEVRQAIYQIVLVLALFAGFYTIISNTLENMRRQNIASGFGFWNRTAGFDIGQHLVPYSATSSYGDAFWVGMWNTLLIAGIGIILATLIGFVVGIARLSRNWLVARLATVYVETLRNMPLLLQLFFWYFAVLKALPQAREAMQLPGNIDLTGFRFYFIIFVMSVALLALSGIYWVKFRALLARPVMAIGAGLALVVCWILYITTLFGGATIYELPVWGYLSNRGLNLPWPVYQPGLEYVGLALLGGVVATVLIGLWARRRRLLTGQPFPAFWTGFGLIVGLPLLVALVLGRPMTFDMPEKGAFNFKGGMVVTPEFMALLFGLSLYTASFIAEIVRAGILAISKGQKEAAAALGLQPGQALRLVVIPQAMRIVIPPLTSQYLNLTKNSSLGLAIAYPELVSVTGTMLNQTGQAVEIILLVMGCYLTLSLLTSAFMNWFNARVALVER